MIRVQQEDFDPGVELAGLAGGDAAVGAVVSFTGLVRDMVADSGAGHALSAMTLEHYPAMTERQLAGIEAEARARWPLAACLVIHRYGRLEPGDRIVLVATASAHRDAAFDACRFIIDWLKTKAPFWKQEETTAGATWVEARDSDDAAAARWAGRPGRPPVTADIVNLRRARKTRKRRARAEEADASRARHGTAGGERRRQSLEGERARKEHEGRRLDPARNGEGDGKDSDDTG